MVHIVGEGKPLHWGLNLSWIRGPRIIVRALGLQLYWRWRWEHGMRPFEWWFGRILCPQRGHDVHTGAAWARTLLGGNWRLARSGRARCFLRIAVARRHNRGASPDRGIAARMDSVLTRRREILVQSPAGGTSLRLTFIILSTLFSILYVVGFVLIGWLWKLSSVNRVPSEAPAALPAAVAVSRRRLSEAA